MSKKLNTNIVIDLSGNLEQKAKRYGMAMSQFASNNKRAMEMLRHTTVAASRGVDTIGNRFIVAGAAAAYGFKKSFIDTAAQFERYQTMLNKLQGGPEGGAKAMDWIKQFTQDTPYSVDEVTGAFVKLKAFGLDPMNGTMQAIADQAAMMGGTAETIEGISLAFGQAWTKGKLQGEEALQLLERGVPVWDYLVKASKELGHNNGLGYSAQQIQDMASKGQLTRKAIQDLLNQMGKASKGAAKDQMNTWNGMISNMGDHWTLFKNDVMDSGAFNVLKSELGGLLSQLDEMKKTGEYDKLVEEVGGNLVASFRAVSEAAKDVKNVGRELLPVLDGIGRGATAISNAVGGYENLAKILASIYVINKGIRMAAPLAQGAFMLGKGAYTAGSWAAGKRKNGLGYLGALNGATEALSVGMSGATPVYVVNMPGGGLTDMIPGGKPNKITRLSGFKNLMPGIVATGSLGLLFAASQAEEGKRLGAENKVAQVARATLPQPVQLNNKDAFILRAEAAQKELAEPKPKMEVSNPFAMMAVMLQKEAGASLPSTQSNNALEKKVNASLDIKVSDDRVTVKTREAAPGLKVNIDTGPSLMP